MGVQTLEEAHQSARPRMRSCSSRLLCLQVLLKIEVQFVVVHASTLPSSSSPRPVLTPRAKDQAKLPQAGLLL